MSPSCSLQHYLQITKTKKNLKCTSMDKQDKEAMVYVQWTIIQPQKKKKEIFETTMGEGYYAK